MALLILAPGKDVSSWVEGIREGDKNIEVRVWPEIGNEEEIDVVIVWNHPEGSLKKFRNLKLISSMGAGIDHILKDKQLPENVSITRIVGEALTISMSRYIIMAVLHYQRKFSKYLQDKEAHVWDQAADPEKEIQIGILGLGVLGMDVAKKLRCLEFHVSGYSNSRKTVKGIKSYAGEGELEEFLGSINVLVCLLPLTSKTKNFLNIQLFKKLQRGTYLVNVARGNHLVEEDLIDAIEKGYLSGAFLDVYRQEPLPKAHVYWDHPQIMMTPHIASITNTESAIPQIIENYNRLRKGQDLINEVDMEKEY